MFLGKKAIRLSDRAKAGGALVAGIRIRPQVPQSLFHSQSQDVDFETTRRANSCDISINNYRSRLYPNYWVSMDGCSS
jgi:hypothetical protein